MPTWTLAFLGTITTSLALTACSSGGAPLPAASSSLSAATASSPAPRPASSTQGASTTAPAAPQTPAATAVVAGSHCATIDRAAAATLLGFATGPGLSSKAGSSNPTFTKIDDCLYQNAVSGSLGYSIVKVDATVGRSMIAAATSKVTAADGSVVVFSSGIADSVAFTMRLPGGTDSQITALAGDRYLSVASTRKDGDAARSQASAIAAMQVLISAG